jgi:peroxiredoxin
MFMKRFLLAAAGLGFLLLSGCHGNGNESTVPTKVDTAYDIIGKVTGLDTGLVYIVNRQLDKKDSAVLDHGYFKFHGKADSAEFCVLMVSNHSKVFFLENGKISMLVKKDSVRNALIAGTKTQDELNYFEDQLSKPLNDKMTALDKAYDSASSTKNAKAVDSLDKLYNNLDAEQKLLVTDFTKSHPGSIVSAFEIYSNFSYNPRVSQLDSLYKMLDSNIQASYFGREIQNTLEKEKLTAVGNPAPAFTLDDVNGKPVALSSSKGKYTLVDFWASWCGPCRQENPNVVKAYHRFHQKGFDIFGVSLDTDKSKWVAAIKKDGLDWTQVSDLLGWKASVVSLYGIKGIPMNYLLDKNGIIVAKGLRGEDLDKKLQEMLP